MSMPLSDRLEFRRSGRNLLLQMLLDCGTPSLGGLGAALGAHSKDRQRLNQKVLFVLSGWLRRWGGNGLP